MDSACRRCKLVFCSPTVYALRNVIAFCLHSRAFEANHSKTIRINSIDLYFSFERHSKRDENGRRNAENGTYSGKGMSRGKLAVLVCADKCQNMCSCLVVKLFLYHPGSLSSLAPKSSNDKFTMRSYRNEIERMLYDYLSWILALCSLTSSRTTARLRRYSRRIFKRRRPLEGWRVWVTFHTL